MDSSPFDALGLPYGHYKGYELRRAYRAAMLVCHPDKRPLLGIPAGRWPQASYITKAFECLTDPGTDYQALRRVESFPRTFFPLTVPAFPPLPQDKDPTSSIAQCSVCLAFVHQDDLPGHVQYEHRYIGDGGHLAEAEGLPFCRFCSLVMSAGAHAGHMAKRHSCPLCGAVEGSLLDHLRAAHNLRSCDGCSVCEDLVTHVAIAHPTSDCLICSTPIFNDSIGHHMEQLHGGGLTLVLRPSSGTAEESIVRTQSEQNSHPAPSP